MDSTKLLPEQIITGFTHLIWLTLLSLIIVKANPCNVIKYFSVLSSGGAAILATALIGVSFFLGRLADMIISDIIRFIMKHRKMIQRPILALSEVREKQPEKVRYIENKYSDKAFFRSIGCAGILITIFSLWLNFLYGSVNILYAIILIGVLIEISIWRIVYALRKEHRELYDELAPADKDANRNKNL